MTVFTSIVICGRGSGKTSSSTIQQIRTLQQSRHVISPTSSILESAELNYKWSRRICSSPATVRACLPSSHLILNIIECANDRERLRVIKQITNQSVTHERDTNEFKDQSSPRIYFGTNGGRGGEKLMWTFIRVQVTMRSRVVCQGKEVVAEWTLRLRGHFAWHDYFAIAGK